MYITRIRLYNRQDDLANSIDRVRVHVDHVLVGIAAYQEYTEPTTFQDIDMFGREVLVNGSSSHLQLSEVEVYGADDKGE